MRILFVCNQNKNRSKAAEGLFKDRFETRSAGLYGGNELTAEQLEWADIVVVISDDQRREIALRYPKAYLRKRILNFGIPDIYSADDVMLKDILEKRSRELLEPFLEL